MNWKIFIWNFYFNFNEIRLSEGWKEKEQWKRRRLKNVAYEGKCGIKIRGARMLESVEYEEKYSTLHLERCIQRENV